MATRTRAEAFNEWMRRYIVNPDAFEREFQTVQRFLAPLGGDDPGYGEVCAAYLDLLERGIDVPSRETPPPAP